MSRWQIEVGGKWYDMAQDEDSIVRKHYKKDGQFIINMRGSKFQLDFAKMEQTNLDKKHQKEKAVRKIRPPSTWISPDGTIAPPTSGGVGGAFSCCSGVSHAQSGAAAEVIPPMDDEEVEGPAEIPADAPPLVTPTPSEMAAEEVAAPQQEPPASTADEVPTGTLKLGVPPTGSTHSAHSGEQPPEQPGPAAGLKEQQPTSASPPATTWTAGLLGRQAGKAKAPPAATLPSGKQHQQPAAVAPGEDSKAAPEEQPEPQEVPPPAQPATALPPATTWAGASQARPEGSGAPPTATAPNVKLGGGQQQQQQPVPTQSSPVDTGEEKSTQQAEQHVPEPAKAAPQAVPTKTLPVGKGPGKWGKPPLQTQ